MRFYQIWFWSYFESTQTHSKIWNLTMQIIHHWTILTFHWRKIGRENGWSNRLKVDVMKAHHWNDRKDFDDHSNPNWTVQVLSISWASNWTYDGPHWLKIPCTILTVHLMKLTVQVISVRPSTIISSLKWPSSELKWTGHIFLQITSDLTIGWRFL